MSEDERGPSLSPDEERTLTAVLDEIIPPSADGRFPGAGELGLVEHVEQTMQRTPELRPVVAQGLSAIREVAGRRDPEEFPALSRRDKLEVLNEVAAREPGFIPSLVLHVYTGYYQNGRVLEALGLEPRPPHPEGYEVEPDDLTLLEPVRQRPKFYREG